MTQKGGDPPVPTTAILTGTLDDIRRELLFVIRRSGHAALGRARLTNDRTRPAFRHAEHPADLIDRFAAPGGACYFPRSASCRISLSNVRSETARRNRVFSASSSFSRFT